MSGLQGFSGSNNGATESFVKDTTTGDFVRDVIEASSGQPILVDFWAPWCGPCKQLTPILERVVNEAGGRVRLVKMNIDENPEIPGQMGVQSIPAVVAFKDGKPVDGFMGAVPESQIKDFIDKIAGPGEPSQAELLLEQAQTLLNSGNANEALQFFNAYLQQNPDDAIALTGLARCALELGEEQKARDISAMVPEDQRHIPEFKALEAQLNLLEKAGDSGEIDGFLKKLETEPDDHGTRFELALALNAAGKRVEAADELLKIVAKDRDWNEDGARKELLTFFEAWGPKDEATLISRRKLSSLLFS